MSKLHNIQCPTQSPRITASASQDSASQDSEKSTFQGSTHPKFPSNWVCQGGVITDEIDDERDESIEKVPRLDRLNRRGGHQDWVFRGERMSGLGLEREKRQGRSVRLGGL